MKIQYLLTLVNSLFGLTAFARITFPISRVNVILTIAVYFHILTCILLELSTLPEIPWQRLAVLTNTIGEFSRLLSIICFLDGKDIISLKILKSGIVPVTFITGFVGHLLSLLQSPALGYTLMSALWNLVSNMSVNMVFSRIARKLPKEGKWIARMPIIWNSVGIVLVILSRTFERQGNDYLSLLLFDCSITADIALAHSLISFFHFISIK